ncbi:MAG: mannose-1-phosphate guanylyltransferase [Candidatus Aminicenantia bacterium]
MANYAIIMAGGRGTRFWPLSRKGKPKQFLPIISEKTMLEETVERLLPLIPYERIYTIANQELTNEIYKLIPNLPEQNLIIEPKDKNTAPSLILSTSRILLDDPEATIIALPADHIIHNRHRLLQLLDSSLKAAQYEDYLITLGITPTYPATGYGYLHYSKEDTIKINQEEFYLVKEFKEKPDYHQAVEYLSTKNYFWNSGIFVWQGKVFSGKLEKYAPEMYGYFTKISDALKKHSKEEITQIFNELPSISIDYALMEKAKGVLVAEADFGWTDVGSWSALPQIWPQDKDKNVTKGELMVINSSECIVYNPNKLTALVGVNNLIIIQTPDVLLICNKKDDQKIKELVEKLKKEGKEEYS